MAEDEMFRVIRSGKRKSKSFTCHFAFLAPLNLSLSLSRGQCMDHPVTFCFLGLSTYYFTHGIHLKIMFTISLFLFILFFGGS